MQGVLSEDWLDREGKPGRRRVRVVETRFKYPHVRQVERVWTDPDSGEPRVEAGPMSVASHVLAGVAEETDVGAARDELIRRGFVVAAAQGRVLLVRVPEFAEPHAQAETISRLGDLDEFISFSEPDYLYFPCLVPNDPFFQTAGLWGLHNPENYHAAGGDADIDAPEGWTVRNSSPQVVVAVTDTGVRHTHEDLAQNMWRNTGETPGDGLDNDRNGVIDDLHGLDAVDDDGDPMDSDGHGTHCAGTVGARGDNELGVTGVSWDVQLMALRFLGPNGGTSSDAIRVINYALAHGADVISASWGGGGYSQGLYEAIEACSDAGVLFVAAAGNDKRSNDDTPFYPAGYDLPNVVAVAATNPSSGLSHFSNHGAYSVDIAAPGSYILSTYHRTDSDYTRLYGTSMATPHVTGALALARAEFPRDSVGDLLARLYSSAERLPSLEGKTATGGRLNLEALLTTSSPVPAHDQFDQAYRFHGTYGFWAGTNARATREDGEDLFSLPGTGQRSLWFAWQAPFEGLAQATVESATGPVEAVLFRGASRDDLAGLQTGETMHFYAEAGQEYRLVIDSDSVAGDHFTVRLDLRAANDNVADATVVAGDGFFVHGNNREATSEPFEAESPHAGTGRGNSVWWRWTPEFDGRAIVSTAGSAFDTVLAVYSGGSAMPESFVEVAASDDLSSLNWTSQVEFDAEAGTDYFIAVDSYADDAWGDIELRGLKADQLVVRKQPEDVTVPLGGRAEFEVAVVGGAGLAFQWFRDGEAIPGATSAQLAIEPVTAEDFGVYEVDVRNLAGVVRSEPAEMIEQRTLPRIVWHTGDVAAVNGDPVRLGVEVIGSEPLTFAWSKDGEVLAGETLSSLVFAPVGAADAGVYQCTASNDLGEATASMVLSTVDSPLDGWTWRRDGIAGAAVTDLKVIEGKLYAVSGERVLVSSNGEDWMPWRLPTGFEGKTIAKLGSVWYCSGSGPDGEVLMARSFEGVEWQAPEVVELIGAFRADGPMWHMESFAGKLVGWAAFNLGNSGEIFYSADGVHWHKPTVNALSGPRSELITSHRFVRGGGKLALPGTDANAVLVTDDGMTWTDVELPLTSEGEEAGECFYVVFLDGVLQAATERGWYRSADGANWTESSPLSLGGVDTWDRVHDLPAGLLAFRGDQKVGWNNGGSALEWRTVYPNRELRFTSSVTFADRVIYGMSNGAIGSATNHSEVVVATPSAVPVQNLSFLNGEFVAAGYTGNADTRVPILVSGDGMAWREARAIGDDDYVATAFVNGNYYGHSSSNPGMGAHPATIVGEDIAEFATPVPASVASHDGLTLAVTEEGLFVVGDNDEPWTRVEDPDLATLNLGRHEIQRFKGAWFLHYDGAASPVLRSIDGQAWEVVPEVEAGYLAELGGVLFGLDTEMERVWSSPGGVNWTSAAIQPDNLPEAQVRSLYALEAFNGALVGLVGSRQVSNLMFSPDGQSWFPAKAPGDLIAMEQGAGQLVLLTQRGGILQTGPQTEGGAAPRVSLSYPGTWSYHVAGSIVEVRGEATDPDGELEEIVCLVDGKVVASATESPFRFSLTAESVEGHVVVVRARDAHGLIGSDELRVAATFADVVDRVEAGVSSGALAPGRWIEFGGSFYAVGADAVFRSRDGIEWTPVPVPVGTYEIEGLAAGSGSLIVEFEHGLIATTRDGINWTHFFSTVEDAFRAARPLRFEGGWFVGRRGYSRDGVTWLAGPGDDHWDVYEYVVTEGGVLIGTASSGTGVWRSIDEGSNWIQIAELPDVRNTRGALASGAGLVVAGFDDGRILLSEDEGLSWDEVAALPSVPILDDRVKLSHQAGLFFFGAEEEWLYVSSDGRTWEPLDGDALQSAGVDLFAGGYIGSGFRGPVWSEDGVTWYRSEEGPPNVRPESLAANGELAAVADTNGGTWTSFDGRRWAQQSEGAPLALIRDVSGPAASERARALVRFGDRLVVGGDYGLVQFSDDEGLTWHPGSLQGGPFSTWASFPWWSFLTLDSGSDYLLALAEDRNSRELLWSGDGRDWIRLRRFRHEFIVDVEANGSEALALAQDGTVWHSGDGGRSWEAAEVPGMLWGYSLHHFDGQWVAFGTDVSHAGGTNLVFTSNDGLSWGERGTIAGESGEFIDMASAVAFGSLFVALEDGRVFRAADNDLQWSEVADVDRSRSQPPRLRSEADRLWLGRADEDPGDDVAQYVSNDGEVWTAVEAENISHRIVDLGGVLVESRGLAWSTDGVTWHDAANPALRLDGELLWLTDGAVRAVDIRGAVWETSDGTNWVKIVPEAPTPSNRGVARELVELDGTLIAGGDEGFLMFSDDGGRSWSKATFAGRPVPGHWAILHLASSGSAACAAVSSPDEAAAYTLWKTTDGRDWEQVAELADLDIRDVAFADGEWLAVSVDGAVRIAGADLGTWEAVDVPGLVAGYGVTYQGDLWVLFGAESGRDASECVTMTSPDGRSWTNRGVVGTLDWPRERFYRHAHGNLIFGTEDHRKAWYTEDGISWLELGTNQVRAITGHSYEEIVEGPAGSYLAVYSSGSTRHAMFTLDAEDGEWTDISPFQLGVVDAARHEGMLFLFGEGSIRLWSELDIALTADELAPLTTGVGDEVAVTVEVRNRGQQALPAGKYAIDAWLTTDGFFGDRDDRQIGRTVVQLSELVAGEATTLELLFQLPNEIPVGASRLVLDFDPDRTLVEPNVANNVWMQREDSIDVPQWRLDWAANGDGRIELDSATPSYPHGATVSLTANAGKGARFAGWSGDAAGGLSQITILMDQDRSVVANFAPAVSLQLRTRGGGRVTGLAGDGLYGPGETAVLTAVPEPGWSFAGWSGDAASSAPGLSVVVTGAMSVTANFELSFEGWQSLHFDPEQIDSPQISGPQADPDGDGLSNEWEHLHGSSPVSRGEDGVLRRAAGGGYYYVVFTRLETMPTGAKLDVLGSRDLRNWDPSLVQQRVLRTEGGIETVEARLPIAGGALGMLGFSYMIPMAP